MKKVAIFLILFQKKEFDISCKLSQLETISMKCQILFSGKNKRNISIWYLMKILPRVLWVKNTDSCRQLIMSLLPEVCKSCSHLLVFSLCVRNNIDLIQSGSGSVVCNVGYQGPAFFANSIPFCLELINCERWCNDRENYKSIYHTLINIVID